MTLPLIMPDLIAQGSEPEQRWRRALPEGRKCALGRSSGAWAIPWDDRISRRHVEICWQNGCLEIEKLAEARNPVFFRGRQRDSFSIRPGEHFVIGGTTFTLADEKVNVSVDVPRPVSEQSFSPQYLKRHRFRNADQRIEVLSRLPEIVSGATSDTEMFVRLVNVLLTGVPRASAAAVVAVTKSEEGKTLTPALSERAARRQPAEAAANEKSRVEVLHWDRRLLASEGFSPSERLIRQAVESGESVVHSWSAGEGSRSSFTLSENIDWAFCTPVLGEASRGWAIYVAGSFGGGGGDNSASTNASDPHELRDDLKFTELAASTLSSLREVRKLERNQTSLSQFFSPVVMEALAGQDPEVVLAPREAEVSVLFCDLRGFSRSSERSAGDLLGLLKRVSEALGIMTHHILEQGGVVGDFHGDAAMGFWGWPLAQQDSIERACQAALGVRDEFEVAAQQSGHTLADFRVGIGIATGQAVAGKIGTVDQVKVTVFGPVVNLASRLEGMTKLLRAPILLDEDTARVIRATTPREVARVRRLAVVKPYGLDKSLEVSELLPPESQFPQLTDDDLANYEAALDAFLTRDWSLAFELLHKVPAKDRVKDFLTVYIAQHNRTPPDDWDGVITLTSK